MADSFFDYLSQKLGSATKLQTTSPTVPQPLQIVDEDDEQIKIDAIEFDGNGSDRLSIASSLCSLCVDTDTGEIQSQEQADRFWQQLQLAAIRLVSDVMRDDGNSKILKQRLTAGTTNWEWNLIQLKWIFTHEGLERALIRAREILTQKERDRRRKAVEEAQNFRRLKVLLWLRRTKASP